VNIEDKNNYGYTALIAAANKGFLPIVGYLVKNKANIEAKGNNGDTALISSVFYNKLDIVKYLVEKRANIEAKGNNGDTALIIGASYNRLNIVKYLVEKGANIYEKNKNGDTALIVAANKGFLPIVKYLVERGANIEAADENGDTALINALFYNKLDISDYLLEKGANIQAENKYGDTALINAVVKDRLYIVKYLVEKGANIQAENKYGDTALTEAVKKGFLPIVKYLVEKGAIEATDENKYGNIALTEAVKKGFLPIVKYLVEKGANIEATDKYGNIPSNSECRRFRYLKLETNKICGPKAYSFGTIEVKINEAKLHDRLSLGGNSRIWGGLIDTSEIPSQVINKFKLHGIEFIKLSYSRTGSISNNSNIYQISKQDCILDTKNELDDFINGYLVSFFIKGNKIGLNILTASNNNKIIKKTIFTRKLILCAGVIQTVDLLYRSKFIKNGDKKMHFLYQDC
jgi:ankyrin repeat protein